MATAAGGLVGNSAAVGDEGLADGHDLGIHVERTGTMAGLAADAFLLAIARREECVIILPAVDVAQEATVVGDRVLQVGIVRSELCQEERPVGAEPPVGVTVTAAKRGDVWVVRCSGLLRLSQPRPNLLGWELLGGPASSPYSPSQ
jgi:hypothetical protein